MGKKIFSLLTILLLVALFTAGCGGSNAGGQKFINIATGGTSGTYFPLGGALAEIWNKNIQGVNATAQTTGASVANVNLLKDGKAEVIFVQNDIAYYAYNGTEMFKDNKYEDIRGLATLYPETIQIVTRADKGIKTLDDLKGKKVAVGSAGSGTEANARQILEAAGITYNDIQVQYLSFADAANNLKDGNIDAAFVTAGYPTAAIQDIAAQHKIVLIPLDDKTIETLTSKYPFYTRTVIPANTYSGQTEDVVTVSVKSMLAVSAKYDEDTVYQLVKTMYENQERLKAAHSSGELIVPDTGKEGMSIPLHPGAEKYFNEIGK
ncbi:TAXI family TRAP transporter solute-binding subunit [Thermosediminibacter oceani]|uniref:TRAP transporter solute receptor, TAXI family n=1 Tax=Thermosediminibacter oceani (strain ATCC BAA-1034 / DSM 16646 / JW/IW-1228P) TaxID=555079 RepID=D9RYC3_THEOJ|nr:TAXI family TRAP transporter solute-binding subunit [Thermosediminibacter oceani]ADL08347.1 TRAP transporter solute receptor, TAXI family [Thermosediminibacter oceani DSM 16646]